jgi:dGTPase
VAYINHDIDDAVRAGVLREDELPGEPIAVLGDTGSERIDTLVGDIVESSRVAGDIEQSEEVGGAMDRLRDFMFERVYLSEGQLEHQQAAVKLIRAIVDHLLQHPDELPTNFRETDDDLVTQVVDYVAGMTDRFAIATHQRVFGSSPLSAGAFS